jgi:hypothetical protein
VVGSPAGPSNPKDFARQTGNYVLSNANFFVVPGKKGLTFDVPSAPLDTTKYGNYAVEPTSSTKNHVDMPSVHKKYYAEFKGDDRTSLWSGPELRNELDLSRPELRYFEADKNQTPYQKSLVASQPQIKLTSGLLLRHWSTALGISSCIRVSEQMVWI